MVPPVIHLPSTANFLLTGPKIGSNAKKDLYPHMNNTISLYTMNYIHELRTIFQKYQGTAQTVMSHRFKNSKSQAPNHKQITNSNAQMTETGEGYVRFLFGSLGFRPLVLVWFLDLGAWNL